MKKIVVPKLSLGLLLCSLMPLACLGTETATRPPALLTPAATTKPGQSGIGSMRREIDRQLRDAQNLRSVGNDQQAISLMLDAAKRLHDNGFERDQVTILRDMTLDPDPNYTKAGSNAMAGYYYQKYLDTKPRDAQWLLEALAWVHYGGDKSLLKRFTARAPDKAHENIDERSRLRGEEMKADDRQYLVREMIRLNKVDELKKQLKDWPYPIDRVHSLEGTSLLHSAVWYKKTGIARMLVEEYHANINVVDKQNDTPLDYAEFQQADDLVKYLTEKGAKSNKHYSDRAAKMSGRQPPVGQPTLEELKRNNPDALKLPANALPPTAPAQPVTAQPATSQPATSQPAPTQPTPAPAQPGKQQP